MNLLAADSTDALAEIYGALPSMRSVSISPDGQHVAFIQRGDGKDNFLVINRSSGALVGAANATEVKARSIYFVTNHHVILVASETRSSYRIRGDWEHSAAISYDIRNNELTRLPSNDVGLFHAQGGLGSLVGVDRDRQRVYLPAFLDVGRRPGNYLLEIDLDDGEGRVVGNGNRFTRDWFVGSGGAVLAREDFDYEKGRHTIHSLVEGEAREIWSRESDVPVRSFNAISVDETELVFVGTHAGEDALFRLSLADGSISEPARAQTDRDIDGLVVDSINRHAIGVEISGAAPTYLMDQPETHQLMVTLQNTFPASTVNPVSMTSGMAQLVFAVSGNDSPGRYILYDREADGLIPLGERYPQISSSQIGPVAAITYPARDGTRIPAILTSPPGTQKPENLPLLVFPHGGPEAHDGVVFDWWAQFFARQGYLVLQPNFRGSTGYGNSFRLAGHGEWGRLMQHDVSDGVAQLVKSGYADPDRVCIMGASYGGYSALAGGAFTPELYRCVIAVAGVSDLPRMLGDERFYSGRNHWVVSYWENLVGDSQEDRELLREISPVNFASQFRAPVLLIHGKDDTVVPTRQSKRMASALRRARRSVEYIELKGEDHWLSRGATRLATLRAISAFLKKHNPI